VKWTKEMTFSDLIISKERKSRWNLLGKVPFLLKRQKFKKIESMLKK
jgi:hypothetical protein